MKKLKNDRSERNARIVASILLLVIIGIIWLVVTIDDKTIKDGIWRQRNGNMLMEIEISGNEFCFLKGLEGYDYPQKGTYKIINQPNSRQSIILTDEDNNIKEYTFTRLSSTVAIIIDGKLFTRRRLQE